jgi:hypothetical protein
MIIVVKLQLYVRFEIRVSTVGLLIIHVFWKVGSSILKDCNAFLVRSGRPRQHNILEDMSLLQPLNDVYSVAR